MLRFLAPYRVLLRMPSAARFIAAGLISRLGMAMIGVSIIVMIAERRDSYALAGLVSLVGLSAMAVGGPVIGRLADRYGQRRIVLPAGLLALAALALLAIETYLGAPSWVLLLTNLGQAGAAQVSTFLRSRWVHLLEGDPAALHTATSFESVVEEGCFMVGPALGALLAATVFPEAGLAAAIILSGAGLVMLMTHTVSEPPVHPHAHQRTGAAFRAPGLLGLAATVTLTGAIFGSLDVVVIAFAEAQDAKAWGGLALGIFAGGSLIGGLIYGLVPSTGALAGRVTLGTLVMFVFLLPTLWAPNLLVLSLNALLAGLAIAPLMVTSMLLAQRLVPPAQLNEGMTIVVTGILIGVGLGSAVAGQVVQSLGAQRGFLVPVIAAAIALLLALASRGRLIRAEAARSGPTDAAPAPDAGLQDRPSTMSAAPA